MVYEEQTDVIYALITLLQEDKDVTALTTKDYIIGGEIGLSVQKEMPRPAVLLKYSGGIQREDYVPLQRPRVDVTCYGRTFQEADYVNRVVQPVLKNIYRKVPRVWKDNNVVLDTRVLLHSAQQVGGPIQGREQGTKWPYSFSAWSVLAAERATLEI